MPGQVGVAHQRADPQPAVGQPLDLGQRQVIDVDHLLRLLDVELHQVEQGGAAGDEAHFGALLRGARAGGGADRLAGIGGAGKGKRFHHTPPWVLRTCWIAATMLL